MRKQQLDVSFKILADGERLAAGETTVDYTGMASYWDAAIASLRGIAEIEALETAENDGVQPYGELDIRVSVGPHVPE